ncbi:MAG: ATP-binding protein [Thermodesulfobacteriota bacterium]|nr:ATP-binding protein [Thermodesulfobacteriota bacterium]
MYRSALNDLNDWHARPSRKPLIVRGARQIGKTWLVREFAKRFDNLVEINFDRNPEKGQLFIGRDIHKGLEFLEIDCDTEIIPGKTLLFLDEIQAVPEMLPLLRYFHEEVADLHVIAAGSLLEFLLSDHDFSMPVGRVEYLHLGPMQMEEFLMALGQDKLAEYLNDYQLDDPIPESIHKTLLHYLKLFWIIGGMPAAVRWYVKTTKLAETIREHSAILQTYEDDFNKYRKRIYPQRLRTVFRRIPAIIGNKLKYVNLDPNERSRDLADSLHLLEMARVIYLVKHSSGNGIPLGAEVKERIFKPLFLDIGLVSTSLGLNLPELETGDNLMMVNNGALAEQYIGQHLLYARPSYEKPQLFYWNREQKNSSAEIDYLIAYTNNVVPIEVKAGKTGTLKSLQVFVAEKKTPIALRFNALPPSTSWQQSAITEKEKVTYKFISLPLYLAGQTRRLLGQPPRRKPESAKILSDHPKSKSPQYPGVPIY